MYKAVAVVCCWRSPVGTEPKSIWSRQYFERPAGTATFGEAGRRRLCLGICCYNLSSPPYVKSWLLNKSLLISGSLRLFKYAFVLSPTLFSVRLEKTCIESIYVMFIKLTQASYVVPDRRRSSAPANASAYEPVRSPMKVLLHGKRVICYRHVGSPIGRLRSVETLFCWKLGWRTSHPHIQKSLIVTEPMVVCTWDVLCPYCLHSPMPRPTHS